jgi:hypothetical protein
MSNALRERGLFVKGSPKTNNSHLAAKVFLRTRYLPGGSSLKILDAFHGQGEIWARICQLHPEKKITVVGIDKNFQAKGVLRGDNLKYLSAFDLSVFDAIDLDAYGRPYRQLDLLFKKGYRGQVYLTDIQMAIGGVPKILARSLGYSDDMVRQCPTLFAKKSPEQMKLYLAAKGVERVAYFYFSYNTKTYLTFGPQVKSTV